MKLLGVFTHGPGPDVHQEAGHRHRRLQGLKIRTGGGIAEAVAKALGASAFVKPAPESYELLKSGVADGVFFPLESIISFKLDTVLKYATLFPGGMYSSAFGFFMNEDKWNKLPKQDQDAIEKVSGEHARAPGRRSWDAADREGHRGAEEVRRQDRRRQPGLRRPRCRSAPRRSSRTGSRRPTPRASTPRKVLAEFREELKKVAAGK